MNGIKQKQTSKGVSVVVCSISHWLLISHYLRKMQICKYQSQICRFCESWVLRPTINGRKWYAIDRIAFYSNYSNFVRFQISASLRMSVRQTCVGAFLCLPMSKAFILKPKSQFTQLIFKWSNFLSILKAPNYLDLAQSTLYIFYAVLSLQIYVRSAN